MSPNNEAGGDRQCENRNLLLLVVHLLDEAVHRIVGFIY